MFPDLLRHKLAGIVTLGDGQVHQLQAHYELLLRWNRVLNLTSVDTLEEAVERHFCESLFLASHLPPGPARVVDIGSGGGFPGIPVAILRADCPVTLIEAHQRKAVFLREVSRGMTNVRVLAQRAEAVEERFDCVVSRAVAYKDLAASLRRFATSADLLTGGEAPPAYLGFEWQAPIPLPWGQSRFLRIGVSRET